MLSSSDVENHKDPHWVLSVWPDGKLILTTPNTLEPEEFERAKTVFQNWLRSEDTYPLIISNCLVQLQAVAPREVNVEQQVPVRQARAGVHRGP